MISTGGILADTCIWIEFFRSRSPLSEELRRLIQEGRIVIAGIVILELLQGARNEKTKKTIKEAISALPYLETTFNSWLLAGEMSFALRRQGISIPTSDILLAALARENNCSIFTTDSHLKMIPDIRLHPLP